MPDRSKPDQDGFIHTWLALFPAPQLAPSAREALDKQQIPGEESMRPRNEDKVSIGDKHLLWQTLLYRYLEIDFSILSIDDRDIAHINRNSVGYVATYLVAEKEMTDVTMLLGSTDEAKVYFNGQEVLRNTEKTGRTEIKTGEPAVTDKIMIRTGMPVLKPDASSVDKLTI
jgi:hypothetical protein